jgi:hypothetical protein
MKARELFLIFFLIVILFVSTIIFAGSISNSSAPVSTGYTLTDIYNLIHEVGPASEGVHNLYPSVSSNTLSSYSISQLYADLANLIKRENVETGVSYLGVTGDYGNPDLASTTTAVITASLTPTVPLGNALGYSLGDIWNLIDQNATTTPGTHANTPAGTPADSGHSLTEIYDALVALGIEKAPNVKLDEIYLGQVGTYVFTGPYSVTFSTVDANGGLSATVNDVEINSGDIVEGGSSITFTATPDDGYFVDEWSVNGSVQEGQTNNEFVIADLQANTEVTVSFVDYSTWLLLDMPFEAGSDASTTPDISGNENNGTVTGATWSDSSGHNSTGGYYFNGQYITLGARGSLQNLSEMSIEVWAKPTFLWGGSTGNRIMCLNPWGWTTGRWCIYFWSGSSVYWSVVNSGGVAAGSAYNNGGTFTLDEWYHIIAVYNGTNTIVYVNGNPGETVGSLTGTISSANLPVFIGYNGGDYYKGYIDGVKIYNKGLTAEQVNILYNR